MNPLAQRALAALTKDGTVTSGAIADLDGIARYVDYLNHDGSTADDVRALLSPHVRFDDERWYVD